MKAQTILPQFFMLRDVEIVYICMPDCKHTTPVVCI